MGFFQILIFIVWALSALALVALVLMHSGKGTGISGHDREQPVQRERRHGHHGA